MSQISRNHRPFHHLLYEIVVSSPIFWQDCDPLTSQNRGKISSWWDVLRQRLSVLFTFTFKSRSHIQLCLALHDRNMFWLWTTPVTSQLVIKSFLCCFLNSENVFIMRTTNYLQFEDIQPPWWFHYSIVLEWVHSQSTVGLLFVLPSFSAFQAGPKVMDSMTVQFPFTQQPSNHF